MQEPGDRPLSSSDKENNFAPNLGWVSVEEIKNVFIEALRTLDKDIMKGSGAWSRDSIFKHIETVQYDLYKRARKNYQEFIRFNPQVPKALKDMPDSRDTYQKRIDSLRR